MNNYYRVYHVQGGGLGKISSRLPRLVVNHRLQDKDHAIALLKEYVNSVMDKLYSPYNANPRYMNGQYVLQELGGSGHYKIVAISDSFGNIIEIP